MNIQKIKKYAFLTISAIPAILLNFAPLIFMAVIAIMIATNNPPTESQHLAEYMTMIMQQTISLTMIVTLAIFVYLISNPTIIAILALVYVVCCTPIAWTMARVLDKNPQS